MDYKKMIRLAESMDYDEMLKLTDRSINFGDHKFNVKDIKCVKCGRIFDGVLFLGKDHFSVTDTLEFMLFSDGVHCDQCIGTKY